MKNKFFSIISLSILFVLLTSCISLQYREMTACEQAELEILCSVEVVFNSHQFFHIPNRNRLKSRAYTELLDVAQLRFEDNIDIRNISITGTWNNWNMLTIPGNAYFGITFAYGLGFSIFAQNRYDYLGFGLPLKIGGLAGIGLIGNSQRITATGDVVLLSEVLHKNIDILPEANNERRFSLLTSPIVLFMNILPRGYAASIINPIHLHMDIELQYKINHVFNISFTTAFSMFRRNDLMWGDLDRENRLVSYQIIFKPMLVYRPFRTGLNGFYIGWYSNIGWEQIQRRQRDYIFMQIGTGLNIGYKWIFRNGFTLQLGTGLGKTWNIPNYIHYDSIFNADGRITHHGRFTLPRFDYHLLDLKIGFSF